MKVILTTILIVIGFTAFSQNRNAQSKFPVKANVAERPASAPIKSAVQEYIAEAISKSNPIVSQNFKTENIEVKVLRTEGSKTYARAYQGKLPIYELLVLEMQGGSWRVTEAHTYTE